LRVADFDFHLPAELIAQEPLPRRDASRLLVLRRATGAVEHRRFPDLLDYLGPGDALVINDTRVLPARLVARRSTGARVEFLMVGPGEALARPARRARPGERYELGPDAWVEVLAREGEAVRVALHGEDVLRRHGSVPLPPYVRARLDDPERYQTVYARHEGSAAAPTAGLHFTPELLDAARARGVEVVRVTLHVGLGTFAPVRADAVEDVRLHAEWHRVTPEAAAAIGAARRVVAVGTTVTRTLEARAGEDGRVRPGEGWTDLFISPGHRFRVVGALLTNFHLPRSTLLMLVSAFAGRERVLAAYREAVRERYRFFSFGDAMLIL
jgi:S-adenosylmethionine:tRNA ribosyltransferase-isomerase